MSFFEDTSARRLQDETATDVPTEEAAGEKIEGDNYCLRTLHVFDNIETKKLEVLDLITGTDTGLTPDEFFDDCFAKLLETPSEDEFPKCHGYEMELVLDEATELYTCDTRGEPQTVFTSHLTTFYLV